MKRLFAQLFFEVLCSREGCISTLLLFFYDYLARRGSDRY